MRHFSALLVHRHAGNVRCALSNPSLDIIPAWIYLRALCADCAGIGEKTVDARRARVRRAQRRAVLDAAALAGLNVLRVMNETAAAALCWGLPKVPAAADYIYIYYM